MARNAKPPGRRTEIRKAGGAKKKASAGKAAKKTPKRNWVAGYSGEQKPRGGKTGTRGTRTLTEM
jgi:hypothetical protein